MALQMRVYAEIASVEAKVMWGMGWRQLVASALMLVLGGGEVAVFFLLLGQLDLGSYLFRGVSAAGVVGMVASQGSEAGTLSGLHALPALWQELPHAGEFGAGQVACETVVEGTRPPQGRGKERAWPLRARNARMAGV